MNLAIDARGLEKRYGSTRALCGIDLQVEEGTLFGLLGPNGAGKTTAFGILCGWIHPDRGSVRVLNTKVTEIHTLRGQLAALPQDAAFPPQITLEDELIHLASLQGMPKSTARDEAARVLELVGLGKQTHAKAYELSHGMKTRVAIAQTLIGHPRMILLDEPTAGCDPKNARMIRDLVASLVPATTVVISSHNLNEIQELCSSAAILDQGHVRYSGRLEDLTRAKGEVFVELAPGPVPSISEIENQLNVTARIHSSLLEIRYTDERDPSEVIRNIIEMLFHHRVKILGVRRGVTLEGAFLELIERGNKTDDRNDPEGRETLTE